LLRARDAAAVVVRLVPVGQGALARAEVRRQELALRRGRVAAADVSALAVQGDHVPGADVPRVVALPVPGCGPEVAEVAGGVRRSVAAAARLVLMVPWGGVDPGLEPTPRRVECRLERAEAAAPVLVVA